MTPSDSVHHHLVAYAETSSGADPGHLVVGHESPVHGEAYFGYRFDIADLPADYQHSSRWRDFLFEHAIPGHIVDEAAYMNRLRSTARTYFAKKTPAAAVLGDSLPPKGAWVRFARYSFNPDDFDRCYNCVSWGVETANRLVPEFLLPVRQGRVKLIIQQMEESVR